MVIFDLNFIRYAPSKMNRFTFSTLIVNLFASNQWVITFTSLRIRESVLRPALITVVSSANIVKELSVQALSRSLMYSRKRKGPITDPCGTPHKTLPFLDVLSRESMYCIRLVKKVSIRLKIFPLKPYISSLRN